MTDSKADSWLVQFLNKNNVLASIPLQAQTTGSISNLQSPDTKQFRLKDTNPSTSLGTQWKGYEKVNRDILFSFSSISLEMIASAVLPTGFLFTVLYWVQRWFCVCVWFWKIITIIHCLLTNLCSYVVHSVKLPSLLLPLPKNYCFK